MIVGDSFKVEFNMDGFDDMDQEEAQKIKDRY